MKISDIKNRKIKLSIHSITVKDDNGKTIGVVKNLTPWSELRTSEQIKYFRWLSEQGLFKPEYLKRLIMCDGSLYYLYDLNNLKMYERYFCGKEGFEREQANYEQYKEKVQKIAEIANVVSCYMV